MYTVISYGNSTSSSSSAWNMYKSVHIKPLLNVLRQSSLILIHMGPPVSMCFGRLELTVGPSQDFVELIG